MINARLEVTERAASDISLLLEREDISITIQKNGFAFSIFTSNEFGIFLCTELMPAILSRIC